MEADGSIRLLDTEQVNPRTRHLDQCSTLELLQLMNAEDFRVPAAVAEALPAVAEAVELIAAALRAGGRLFYVGAGTSGRLGMLDAYECPPTFGTAPGLVQALVAGGVARDRADESAEDDPALGAADLAGRGLAAGDVVVGIAVGAMRRAKALGASVVGLCNNHNTPMVGIADLVIEAVVGPEVILGSTRMKAGTAQKLVLNMLTTTAMIRIGKVYGNLMVDLQPTNEKLVYRSKRIIRMATGASPEQVDEAYRLAGGHVKTAIVMILAGVGKDEACRLLERSGGFVSGAIDPAAQKS
ncbi:N-acetylmuramic acid 6-phosphate etherase [Paenibacillus sp. GYB003]|uniref:N-acetylmuramic acid 6-phosphate etherase n=1 Tax=Paenibacillus sp. GYB003 TaxID=2994392 RepID=UPI002F963AC9